MKKEAYSKLFVLTLFTIFIFSLAIADKNLSGQVIETQTASCQSSSSFVFSAQTSNESIILINTSIRDGEIILPILYGNGTDFTGAGRDSDDLLVTSENSNVQLNDTTNDFVIASYESGSTKESYFLKFSFESQYGINSTDIHIYRNGNFETACSEKTIGETCIINNLIITITNITKQGSDKTVSLAINSGSFNKIFDKNGNYIVLPNKTNFPSTNYIINLYNSSGTLEKKYEANWSDSKTNITKFYDLCASCTANWTETTTSCASSEKQMLYYTQSSTSCNASPPSNKTIGCDFDNNSLIGKFSDISNNMNLSFYILDSQANESKKFTSSIYFSFKEGNITRIKLMHNFDKSKLDLTNINIQKQPADSSFGYLIISGLNVTKTVLIDKLNSSSNSVCVKNKDNVMLSSLSQKCNMSDETLVICDNGKIYGSKTCATQDNYFEVTGIDKSAIKEFYTTSQPSSNQTCYSSWSCSPWNVCKNGGQTRICTDLNDCNAETGKPAEIQPCSSTSAQDTNSSESLTTDSTEAKTNSSYIIIIIVLFILIAIIAGAIIYFYKKSKTSTLIDSSQPQNNSQQNNTQQNYPRSPPSSPQGQQLQSPPNKSPFNQRKP